MRRLFFGAANDRFTEYVTFDMRGGIHELITGNPGLPEDEIDSNLGWMQVALASMDVLESGDDLDGNAEKQRAQTWVALGTGGPAITAGALMLMYEVAIALFIGLGPLFILSLLFESTKSLFQKWLFYGIGTMFSMAVLSAMVTISLRMVTDVAEGMWASDAIATLVPGLGGGGVISYSSRAMQTGSMGMILTLLLVTVPPMVANFFGGTLGNFMHFSAFGAGAVSNAPSASGPAGAPIASGYQPSQPVTTNTETPGQRQQSPLGATTHPVSGLGSPPAKEAGPKQGVAPLRELQGGGYTPSHTAASDGMVSGQAAYNTPENGPGKRGA